MPIKAKIHSNDEENEIMKMKMIINKQKYS